MSDRTVEAIVRDQILAEGPDDVAPAFSTWNAYIASQLREMNHVEFLNRISEAVETRLETIIDILNSRSS